MDRFVPHLSWSQVYDSGAFSIKSPPGKQLTLSFDDFRKCFPMIRLPADREDLSAYGIDGYIDYSSSVGLAFTATECTLWAFVRYPSVDNGQIHTSIKNIRIFTYGRKVTPMEKAEYRLARIVMHHHDLVIRIEAIQTDYTTQIFNPETGNLFDLDDPSRDTYIAALSVRATELKAEMDDIVAKFPVLFPMTVIEEDLERV